MKRATVYFDEDLHKALTIRAAETAASVSSLVNDAVKAVLAEDLDDLESFRAREAEPTVDFETFLKKLKRNGKISDRNQEVGCKGA